MLATGLPDLDLWLQPGLSGRLVELTDLDVKLPVRPDPDTARQPCTIRLERDDTRRDQLQPDISLVHLDRMLGGHGVH